MPMSWVRVRINRRPSAMGGVARMLSLESSVASTSSRVLQDAQEWGAKITVEAYPQLLDAVVGRPLQRNVSK